MCRIVGYFGKPARLASVLTEPPHSLEHQARAAKEMEDGSVAGDGWGVGWYEADSGAEPALLKGVLPIWADINVKAVTPIVKSGCFVGHVRFASPGSEVCFLNTPLFHAQGRLFTHNGGLKPWPGPLSKALRDRLDPEDEASIQGSTDAEMLFAVWRTQFRRMKHRDPAKALRETLRLATDLAHEHGGEIKANLILADPSGFLAVRYADTDPAPSLYVLDHQSRWPEAVVVASEPLDEGVGWRNVPPSTLVRVGPEGVREEPLGL